MVGLGQNWGGLGCTGGDGSIDIERGVSTGVVSVVSDAAGVWDMGGGETVRCWVFRGELGGWDVFGGRFGVPGSEARRFAAADCGPGWGKAWGSIVVVDDVAVRVGA
jgi:hypothetical protein